MKRKLLTKKENIIKRKSLIKDYYLEYAKISQKKSSVNINKDSENTKF